MGRARWFFGWCLVWSCTGCGDGLPPVNPSPSPLRYDARVDLWLAEGPEVPPVDVPASSDGAAPAGDAVADAPSPRDATPIDAGSGPPSIVGTWYNTNAAGCVDEHRFTEGGAYFISATPGERVVGRYRWSPGVAGARAELWISLDSDNGATDCNGVARNESGESHTAYVEFRSPDRAVLYMSPAGADEWFRLAR